MDSKTQRALVLVDAHSTGRESLIRAVMARIAAIFRTAPSRDFYTYEGTHRLAGEVAALDRIAQTTFANQTVAFLDALARQEGVKPPEKVAPIPAQPRGVEPVEVWLRPFEQFRYEYAKSKDEQAAMGALLKRTELTVADDVALGMRYAAKNQIEATPKALGYRRVVHPELARGGSCGLCVVASDQLYHKGQLLPLHKGCNCTIAPVFAHADPGSSLNGLTLQQLYDAAGGTGRHTLQRVRIEHHGELGPTLVPAPAAGDVVAKSTRRAKVSFDDEAFLVKQVETARRLSVEGTTQKVRDYNKAALKRFEKQLADLRRSAA